MTAGITWTCDGTRHGQPCRGALHTRTTDLRDASRQAVRARWTPDETGGHRCPSGGHDDQPEASA